MAKGKGKGAGYLPASQGRAAHIRQDLVETKAEKLPLMKRGGVNRGIQTAPLNKRAGIAGQD